MFQPGEETRNASGVGGPSRLSRFAFAAGACTSTTVLLKLSTQALQASDPHPYKPTPRSELTHLSFHGSELHRPRPLVAHAAHNSPDYLRHESSHTGRESGGGGLCAIKTTVHASPASVSTARRHPATFHGPSQLLPNVRAWICAQEVWLQLVCFVL